MRTSPGWVIAREPYATRTWRGLPGSAVTRPRARSPTTAGSSSCSSGRSAQPERRRVGPLGHVERALGDDRAGVDALVDEVHGHARDLDAVGHGLLDGADAGEGREERRVDVDDALREAREERRVEELHVAGEHDELDAALRQPVGDRRVAGRAAVEVGDREHARRHAGVRRPLERPGAGLVRADGDDIDVATAVELVEDGLQVRAVARRQHADLHAASSTG